MGKARRTPDDSPRLEEPSGVPDGAATSLRLTEAQRGHISLMVRMLANESREWLRDWERRAAPVPANDPFRRTLEAVLKRAESAAERLDIDLTDAVDDPRRELAAWASTWWSAVLNSRPDALRGYGAVDPSVPPVIGPIVEDLAATLLHLATLAGGGAPRKEDS